MDVTPADLVKGPTNMYRQIAVALKAGELREPGLANLAARLVVRVPRQPIIDSGDGSGDSSQRKGCFNFLPSYRKASRSRGTSSAEHFDVNLPS
eukprot:6457796-Prymnesium_polylepis.1